MARDSWALPRSRGIWGARDRTSRESSSAALSARCLHRALACVRVHILPRTASTVRERGLQHSVTQLLFDLSAYFKGDYTAYAKPLQQLFKEKFTECGSPTSTPTKPRERADGDGKIARAREKCSLQSLFGYDDLLLSNR